MERGGNAATWLSPDRKYHVLSQNKETQTHTVCPLIGPLMLHQLLLTEQWRMWGRRGEGHCLETHEQTDQHLVAGAEYSGYGYTNFYKHPVYRIGARPSSDHELGVRARLRTASHWLGRKTQTTCSGLHVHITGTRLPLPWPLLTIPSPNTKLSGYD